MEAGRRRAAELLREERLRLEGQLRREEYHARLRREAAEIQEAEAHRVAEVRRREQEGTGWGCVVM